MVCFLTDISGDYVTNFFLPSEAIFIRHVFYFALVRGRSMEWGCEVNVWARLTKIVFNFLSKIH